MIGVRYLGRKTPLTISMPWLNQQYTFPDNDTVVDMDVEDAERLLHESPTAFVDATNEEVKTKVKQRINAGNGRTFIETEKPVRKMNRQELIAVIDEFKLKVDKRIKTIKMLEQVQKAIDKHNEQVKQDQRIEQDIEAEALYGDGMGVEGDGDNTPIYYPD